MNMITSYLTLPIDSSEYREILNKARTATMNAQLTIKHMSTFHSDIAPLPVFTRQSTRMKNMHTIHPQHGSISTSGVPSPLIPPSPGMEMKRQSSISVDVTLHDKHEDNMNGYRSPSTPARRFSMSSMYDDKQWHHPIPLQAMDDDISRVDVKEVEEEMEMDVDGMNDAVLLEDLLNGNTKGKMIMNDVNSLKCYDMMVMI